MAARKPPPEPITIKAADLTVRHFGRLITFNHDAGNEIKYVVTAELRQISSDSHNVGVYVGDGAAKTFCLDYELDVIVHG